MNEQTRTLILTLIAGLRFLLDLELKTGQRMGDADRLELLLLADELERVVMGDE